ncbi:MAG: PTS system mannose/fructose/sorbose family transporter subunit IID [Erysipelotrichaceae bacterium]
MSEQIVNDNKNSLRLNKRDVNKCMNRLYIGAEMSNSYERLQALVFCASMIPALKKLYPNKEDYIAALKRHLTFYNTDSIPGGIILGITLGMEEQKANGEEITDDAITSLKTGLMGPIAAIGDTIIWAAYMPILIALFLPLAKNGNAMGGLLPFIIYPSTTFFLMRYLTQKGYRVGRDSVLKILHNGSMQSVIFSANVIGLMMMGALSASYVSISTPFKIIASGSKFVFQEFLDGVIPGILPLAAVFLIYIYMVKKGQNFNKILLVVVIVSVIGSLTGIL